MLVQADKEWLLALARRYGEILAIGRYHFVESVFHDTCTLTDAMKGRIIAERVRAYNLEYL